MKLISFLEDFSKSIGQVDLKNAFIDVEIKYKDQTGKTIIIPTFKISANLTVRKLSQEINSRSEGFLTVPTYDPFYHDDKSLYEIYDPDKIEFNVYYVPDDPDEEDSKSKNIPYKVLIKGYKPGIKQKLKKLVKKTKGFFYHK